MTNDSMKSNLESFIDLIHKRIWSMAILPTKSSNEIWSFWTKMRVGANPDHEKIGWIFGQKVSFWNAELEFWFSLWWTWLFGKGSYILIAMSRSKSIEYTFLIGSCSWGEMTNCYLSYLQERFFKRCSCSCSWREVVFCKWFNLSNKMV